jgi:hypothetical protein
MIKDDFEIDFASRTITHKGNKKKVYPAKELYSFLMDLFDEPENMRYDIPILAKSKDKFELINGWQLNSNCSKFIKGSIS